MGLLGDGVQAMSDPDIVARLRIATLPSVCCVKREAADEIERLKAELCTAWEQAERWKDERDEARRLICDLSWQDSKEVARELGWDCFKEEQ